MGQYYRLSILSSAKRNIKNKEKVVASISPYDYNNGAKLCEFSYINNSYVSAFEELINKEHGKYAGYPVICAGDYADEEPLTYNKEKVTIYDLTHEFNTDIKVKISGKHYRYIINEDKKLYIDTENPEVIGEDIEDKENRHYKYYLHPLPIMIADGNGRGGGDLYSEDKNIGAWKRNVVVVSDNKPDDTYKELVVSFFDEWGNK